MMASSGSPLCCESLGERAGARSAVKMSKFVYAGLAGGDGGEIAMEPCVLWAAAGGPRHRNTTRDSQRESAVDFFGECVVRVEPL